MRAFERTKSLIGEAGLEALGRSHIAVIGVGGVGSHAAEAVVRAGVGAVTLVDDACIDVTNINRQIHATQQTVGFPKVDVMRERLLSINPACRIRAMRMRYSHDGTDALDLRQFDYVLDCIDSVSDKEALIVDCINARVRIISSMGAGNRLDPTAFRIMDIYETSGDPLARVMRSRLRKRGIQALKVVCSLEQPRKTAIKSDGRRRYPASVPFVPPVAGLVMASEAVMDIAIRNITKEKA